jgi:hypothetical protein
MSDFQKDKNSSPTNKFGTNFKLTILASFLTVLIVGLTGFCYFKTKGQEAETDKKTGIENVEAKPKAIMILIEYKDTVGLVNFVNELNKRNIPGLLHVSPEFVESNCKTIKELLKYDMEIMASLGDKPFWDISYDEQKRIVSEMKTKIETCTGEPIKIISSPYMASDMTTVKVADELGIPYVTARGTTDTKATVYQIEGYKTKILSVSNIPKVQYKYGSLCDYSYYERAGQPGDMLEELMRAIEPLSDKEKARYGPNHKITPVTHTNIGGYLKPWTDMWLNFWDTTTDKIEWVNLDEFMVEADWTLPDWQMPINKNAPYTPEKIRPLIPYDEVEKVQNPCRVEDIGGKSIEEEDNQQVNTEDQLMIFHNGKGSMCLEAIEFLKTIDYPVEQFLDTETGFSEKLNKLRVNFGQSEGVSESFNYYPIIFIKDRAFSGFNEEIKNEILKELAD